MRSPAVLIVAFWFAAGCATGWWTGKLPVPTASGQVFAAVPPSAPAAPILSSLPDDPGRQPFHAKCSASIQAGGSGFCNIGPVPRGKRLVVETASAIVTTRGRLYDARINGPFELHMMPIQIGETAGVRLYNVTHSARFYLEAGESLQFQAATVDGVGSAGLSVSGYYLTVP